VIVKLQHSAPV